MTIIVPVILAGGGGSRLWPLSTAVLPKQLQALVIQDTMLQATAARFLPTDPDQFDCVYGAPLIVTGMRHADVIANQLEASGVAPERIIVEPAARNTAPAIAAAAHYLSAHKPDALMLVLPADHHIQDVEALQAAIGRGSAAALDGELVTFGIVPNEPNTGYGYIERGEGEGEAFAVSRFVEKPNREAAVAMLEAGGYYWNAGIFLYSPKALLEAMQTHAPDIGEASRQAVLEGAVSGNKLALAADAFGAVRADSIDYAVMEQAKNVTVVPMDVGWSDVGSVKALHEAADHDEAENTARGFVLSEDVENCYLRADSGVVAAIGLRDVAVIRSGEAVLVTPLDRSQDVGGLQKRVTELRQGNAASSKVSVPVGPHCRRLQEWLLTEALPIWGAAAWDKAQGGFYETLTFDGKPNPADDFKRIRVQARQIFACCAGHELGVEGPFLETARAGFSFLTSRGWQEAGGWAYLLASNGNVKDPMRDAYDHAFVLFSLAAYYRASGDVAALNWADRTVSYLDAALVDGVTAGYLESAPQVLPRRANPHMHLFEAFLALFDATGDFAWLNRARSMKTLFVETLFDAETGSVREFFNETWGAAEGQSGHLRDPGHNWEWAFLLHEYGCRSGEDLDHYIDQLTGFVLTHGHSSDTGLAYDECFADGTVFRGTHRLWPQTEALRGLVMLRKRGREGLDDRIEDLAKSIFDNYLQGPIGPGLWVDQLAEDLSPLSKSVPASTLYHLITCIQAFDENNNGLLGNGK